MTDTTYPIVYGTTWCPDCKRSKRFLGEHRIPYTWVDVEQNAQGMSRIIELNNGKQAVPTIVFQDSSVLVEPSNAELATQLGIPTKAERDFYDLIIIGGGPAGLTAALYTAREGIDTLILDRSGLGGQAAVTERLDNFPGFPEGVSGAEFADRLKRQAERFGVETVGAADIGKLWTEGGYVCVTTREGHEYGAHAALVATGSTYSRLGVPGEDDFIGAGIHFCATCDAAFYKDAQELLVIGGGNSATEEGLFLTKFAHKVTLVTIDPDLSASSILREKVKSHPQMNVVYNTTVAEFRGDKRLEAVFLKDTKTGQTREMRPAAVFVFIGMTPNTRFLQGNGVKLNQWGFIQTDDQLRTSMDGVFAAGDVRAGSTKQAASAAGEGATAALAIRAHLQQRSPSREM
ncbi:MAG: FAD-dependent oxidoreductase [Dehalococcoidia bacterium]